MAGHDVDHGRSAIQFGSLMVAAADSGGGGLLDRLIANDYDRAGLEVLTGESKDGFRAEHPGPVVAHGIESGAAMPFVRQRYGKANVRVLRVQRAEDRHEVREGRITVTLDGEFARAYTDADNAPVVATDTMKNLVNVLALKHLDAANESFALIIAECFLDRYEHVSEASVRIDETVWGRMRIDGREHGHSFVRGEGGTPFARATVTRSSREVEAGFHDFATMKTTGSGFVDYLQDEYTTLPPTTDRILATRMAAAWRFEGGGLREPGNYDAVAGAVREALLRVFATTYSYSVQDSLYRMGEAALAAAPDISEITLRMPNVHYLPIDLSPFGQDARGTVFLPTDEPSGQIEATLRRG